LDVLDVGNRRQAPVQLRVLPYLGTERHGAGGIADVVGAVHADVVRAAALGDGGLEAIGVADDPVGHDPAVGPAGHTQALLVDPAPADRFVDDGHEVR